MTTVRFSQSSVGGQALYPGAAAWACTQLGLRVFPLLPGEGTPAVKSWPDLATADPDQIQDWWCGEFQGCGVGVATGPESGVWVLDIDSKKGINGYDTWVELITRHGPIANTFMVLTPSGGAHVYFRWPEDGDIANSTGDTNQLGSGLDVRGTRGYVRAPGWAGYDVIPYAGVRRTRIASAPAWLEDLARRPAREVVVSAPSSDAQARRWSARALERLREAPEGTRNDTLNRTAFRLGIAGSLNMEDAWSACANVLVGMGAGDGMDRWRRTFESGWNAGSRLRDSA